MIKVLLSAVAIILAIASTSQAESLQQLVTSHDSFTVGYLTFSNFAVTSMTISDLTLNDIDIDVEPTTFGASLHILTGPSAFPTRGSGVDITYQVSGNAVDILSMGTGLVSQTYVNPIGRPSSNAFDNTVLFTTVSATWPNMPHGLVMDDPRSPYYHDPRLPINRFNDNPFPIGLSSLATDCHRFDPCDEFGQATTVFAPVIQVSESVRVFANPCTPSPTLDCRFTTDTFASFGTVPEPTTFVLLLSGLMVWGSILVTAKTRR